MLVETNFGLNMLLQEPLNKTAVVSPLSVIFVLAMLQTGSKSNTKTQINRAISEGQSDADTQNYYSRLFSKIQEAEYGVQCRIANGFFPSKNYTIKENYERIVKEKYSAYVRSLDFRHPSSAARIINGFISNNTAGRIHDMVTPNGVKDAVSILVNAIYFTAKWLSPFEKRFNTIRTFYGLTGAERQVEFMNMNGVNRLYAEDEDVQLLSLPYKDTTYALNIFLPTSRSGLSDLRSKLTSERIQNLFSELYSGPIKSVSIPKMKIETELDLKAVLTSMGVSDLFSDRSDLSGMVKGAQLRVSKANHRAVIEIDEGGTTAAAATSFAFSQRRQLIVSKEFTADHPFMFMLTKDGNPLFMGQYV